MLQSLLRPLPVPKQLPTLPWHHRSASGSPARNKSKPPCSNWVLPTVLDMAGRKLAFHDLQNAFEIDWHTTGGLKTAVVTEIQDFKTTSAYQEMVKQSAKRTEEATRLKRKRDHACFRLKLGQRDAKQHRDTDLAKSFIAGTLMAECAAAEAECTTRKLEGVARCLGSRLHG